MANNCLVTKLKVAVDNPNLPYLEKMQQFTLDAITASGNNTMTDEQKWALNHFFYAVGAINNQTLWAKIKYLFIPMICNDSSAKILMNYKNNVVEGTPSTVTFTNHGAAFSTELLVGTAYNQSNKNLTSVIVSMGDTLLNNLSSQFIIGPQNDAFYFCIGYSSDYDGVYTTQPYGLKTPSNVNYDVYGFTSAPSFANVHGINSANTDSYNVSATSEAVEGLTERTLTNPRTLLNGLSTSYGLIMLSDAIVDTDKLKIMEAAKELKLAFSESNS